MDMNKMNMEHMCDEMCKEMDMMKQKMMKMKMNMCPECKKKMMQFIF